MEESSAIPQPSPSEDFIQDVLERLDLVGDLPIFSSSVSRIHSVGSDPDSNAVALATEVLKDANLTTKILKIANSTYYGRGRSRVATLSRAIVLLGFDLIKSTVVAMKLIDSFNNGECAEEIESLLIRSYMSAALTRQLAELSGMKKPEETYICGLLHKMGEIVLYATMPEKFHKIEKVMSRDELSFEQASKKVLPVSVYEIGQAVADHWDFPESTRKTMKPRQGEFKKSLNKPEQFNQAVSAISAEVMELLYLDKPHAHVDFATLNQELAKVCGVSEDQITQSLVAAFNQAVDLAESYGLNKSSLAPKAHTSYGSSDEYRDSIAEVLRGAIEVDEEEDDLSIFFSDDADDNDSDGYDAEAVEVAEIEADGNALRGNTQTLLSIIQQISLLISQRSSLNSVFDKVMQGMVDGLGLDRAILCLLTPDRVRYSGRIAYGGKSEDLRELFLDRRVDVKHDLFSKVMMEGGELWIDNIYRDEVSHLMSAEVKQSLRTNRFLCAALTAQGKPLGFFYADCVLSKRACGREVYRGFLQLVGQAQLALQVR